MNCCFFCWLRLISGGPGLRSNFLRLWMVFFTWGDGSSSQSQGGEGGLEHKCTVSQGMILTQVSFWPTGKQIWSCFLLAKIKEQHFRCHVHLLDDGLSVWWLSVPQQAIWCYIWRSQWPGMDHQPLTSLGKWWVGTSVWHDVKWGILNLPPRRHFTKRFQLVFPPSPCWTHEKYIHQIFSNCKPCKP